MNNDKDNKKFSNFNQDEEIDLSLGNNLVEVNHSRLYTIIFCFILAFTILSSRLIYHVCFSNNEKKSTNSFNGVNYLHRKEIVDRNGLVLAVNLATASLYANPQKIIDPKEDSAKLSKVFPEFSYTHFYKLLTSKKKFVWLKKNLTPKEQYSVNMLGIPGIEFDKAEKRIYTHGHLLSHIIGYVGSENQGLAGIEKYFNEFLITKSDKPEEERLQLSIDLRAQSIVYDEMMATIKEFDAEGGIGLIMNANTGEIVSMISLPDFDPHNPGTAKDYQLFNKATLGTYELGSVFKACTVAMALESKAVALNDVFYVKDPIKIGKYSIKDFRPKGLKWMSVPQILMNSSNIGTVKIALELGSVKQKEYLKSYGFLDPISVELPEKGNSLYPKHWSLINTMTISFGHGIAVTPLHMMSVIGALVNGGNLYNPTLAKIKNDQLIKAKKIISEDTSDKMRRLFRLIVEKGGGKKADVDGYFVGGKTGTAEKATRGGYNHNAKISSFIGAFPMQQPEYVIFMLIDNPKANAKTPFATGAWVAAPLVHRIVSRLAPLLNITPYPNDDPQIKKQLFLEFDTSNTGANL